jgi:hypothetical protein
VILGSIRLALEANHSLGVVVHNSAAKNALEHYLDDKGRNIDALKNSGIIIMTTKELGQSEFTGPLLFCSMPNKFHRNLALYPGSERLAFLAYPSEIPIVQHVFDVEISEARHNSTLDNMIDVAISITGAKRKEFDKLIGKQSHQAPLLAKVVYTSPQKATSYQADLQPIFTSLICEELDKTSDDENEDGLFEEEVEVSGLTSVLALVFENGDTLIIRPTSRITTYDIDSGAITDSQANNLEIGNLTILVDETTTRSLLEVILERLHKHPSMMFHVIN